MLRDKRLRCHPPDSLLTYMMKKRKHINKSIIYDGSLYYKSKHAVAALVIQ